MVLLLDVVFPRLVDILGLVENTSQVCLVGTWFSADVSCSIANHYLSLQF
jgi:hypothetical protein